MMNKKLLGLIVVSLLYCLPVKALELVVEFPHLPVQKNTQGQALPTVEVGDMFQVQVRVVEGNRDTGDIELDGLDQLTVQGKSRSTNISVINGGYQSDTTYVFDVVADKAGTMTLGPAHIKQNNKTISSAKVQLQVTEQATDGKKHNVAQDDPQASNKYDLFARLVPKKKSIVAGEPLEVCLKVYARGPIMEVGIEPPSFGGFVSKEVPELFKQREVVDGIPYNVVEKKYILTPLQAGSKKLDRMKVIYSVQAPQRKKKARRLHGGFFGEQFFDDFLNGPRLVQRTAKSNELDIQVNQLPEHAGRVDAVGAFESFTASLDKKEVAANEPVMLRLEVAGKGNLDQIADPTLMFPMGVKSYKSKAEVQEDISKGQLGGKKVFEFVVQAPQSGKVTIPAQEFTFFDINKNAFQTLKTTELALNVLPGQGSAVIPMTSQSEGTGGGTRQQEKEAPKKEDIHFIDEENSTGNKQKSPLPIWLFLLFALVPLTLFMKLFTNKQFMFWGRSRKKTLEQYNKEIESLIASGDAAQLYPFFQRFFSTKFERSAEAITQETLEKILLEYGFQESKLEEFLDYLNQCASVTFASSGIAHDQKKKLLEKAKYWLLLLNS